MTIKEAVCLNEMIQDQKLVEYSMDLSLHGGNGEEYLKKERQKRDMWSVHESDDYEANRKMMWEKITKGQI